MHDPLLLIIDSLNAGLIAGWFVDSVVGVDEWLRARNEDEFEGKWLNALGEINRIKAANPHLHSLKSSVDSIREQSFKEALRASGSTEVAGYVSDDFELFSWAVILDYCNEWLNGLARAYVTRKSMTQGLTPCQRSIRDIFGLASTGC